MAIFGGLIYPIIAYWAKIFDAPIYTQRYAAHSAQVNKDNAPNLYYY
jgi:hypothetical protein